MEDDGHSLGKSQMAIFLSLCPGVTGKPGWDCHLLSPRWQRAGTVKRTGREKRRIESGLPCGLLRETVSICSSGPNLMVNRFHFYISLYVDLSMHQGYIFCFFFPEYRISPRLVCITLYQYLIHSCTELSQIGCVWQGETHKSVFFFPSEVHPVFLTVHCNFHL